MNDNGVARTLKNYAHQRETIVSRNCVLFLNGNFFKERICSQRERILSEGANSFLYE